MRIRIDFVSNSSSTSFACYGVILNSLVSTREDYGGATLRDEIGERGGKLGLELDGSYELGYYMLGGSPNDCPDSMTMGEWRAQVQEAIKEVIKELDLIVKEPLEFTYVVDGWFS